MIFPSAWHLIHRESAMLECLAANPQGVALAQLKEVIAPYRGLRRQEDGKIGRALFGRPVKVHLYYLRKKLLPHGIAITYRHQVGYRLSEPSRAIVCQYLASSSAVEQRAVNAPVAGSIPASSAKTHQSAA